MTSKTEPTTLESISEDIVPFIAEFIKSWAEVQVVGKDWKNKRSISRRVRDSALRAISLSTRANYSRFIPHLMREVTVSDCTLPSFHFFLGERPHRADRVEVLRFAATTENDDYTTVDKLWDYFAACEGKDLTQAEFTWEVAKDFLSELPNLQTLILESVTFAFPLVESHTVKPFQCFTSLKRLYIGSGSQSAPMMNGQNVIWLLVFCPCLSQAVLGFRIGLSSFKYLQEYVDVFKGLSNIRQLALYPHFVWNSVSSTGHGSWSRFKGPQNLVGNNFETHSIFNLLQVTNDHLESLEIIWQSLLSSWRPKGS